MYAEATSWCSSQGEKDHSKWGTTITSESAALTQSMRRLQDNPHSTVSSRQNNGVKVPPVYVQNMYPSMPPVC